jgi:hypothetical protein
VNEMQHSLSPLPKRVGVDSNKKSQGYKNRSMGLSTQFQSGNQMVHLTTAKEVLDNWDFFLEGLGELQKSFQWKLKMAPDVFLRIILRVIEGGETFGTVCLIRSKSKKLVGFFILQDNSEEFFERTALCYALYSVGNNSDITRDAVAYGIKWCKERGYRHIYALSLRTGAAVRRLFTKKWGFSLHGLWFRKEVS